MAASSSTPAALHSSLLAHPPARSFLPRPLRRAWPRGGRKGLSPWPGGAARPWSVRPPSKRWPAAPSSQATRSAAGGGGGGGGDQAGDDGFGLHRWDPAYSSDDNLIKWVQEDVVTLFTTDGLIQIGGSKMARQVSSEQKRLTRGSTAKYWRFREENYMDPKQGLCLGAIFDIAATNGLDLGRRFCIFGFCRSIEMLSDVVEDTVLEQGGEVVASEKGSRGLNEKLSMTVAMPLLWGIPPGVETLNYAIRSGGGIVEKTYWQWEFL